MAIIDKNINNIFKVFIRSYPHLSVAKRFSPRLRAEALWRASA
jgi:hypothetical protein